MAAQSFAAETRLSFPDKMTLNLISKLFSMAVILVSRIEGNFSLSSPSKPCQRFLRVYSFNRISLSFKLVQIKSKFLSTRIRYVSCKRLSEIFRRRIPVCLERELQNKTLPRGTSVTHLDDRLTGNRETFFIEVRTRGEGVSGKVFRNYHAAV